MAATTSAFSQANGIPCVVGALYAQAVPGQVAVAVAVAS
jgi:hypothetical protein